MSFSPIEVLRVNKSIEMNTISIIIFLQKYLEWPTNSSSIVNGFMFLIG